MFTRIIDFVKVYIYISAVAVYFYIQP